MLKTMEKEHEMIIKLPDGEIIKGKGTYDTFGDGSVIIAHFEDGRSVRVHSINFSIIWYQVGVTE